MGYLTQPEEKSVPDSPKIKIEFGVGLHFDSLNG